MFQIDRGIELLKDSLWSYIYFTDLIGFSRRVLVKSSKIDDKAFKYGLGKLDGSSIRGFAPIENSDLVLKPDRSTIKMYPWMEDTVRMIADIYLPGGKIPFQLDPRYIARETVDFLEEKGWTAKVAAELEFFIFDEVRVRVDPWLQYVRIDSTEAPWSTIIKDMNIHKDGYYTVPPRDKSEGIKKEIAETLERYFDIEVEVMHHEVAAASQHEINFEPGNPLTTADNIQIIKETVRTVADINNAAATFMPKPIFGDNGNGMHVHISLWSGDHNMFYDKDDKYAGISEVARYFVGGLIEHGRALSAIVSPTVNSYKRLVPGYEAPIYLAWSKANRSAAIRIPGYGKGEKQARIEYRSPDPSANPYLALSAIILAGIDGIKEGIDPGDPVDKNIYKLTTHERRALGIKELPKSLDEALDCLESDNEWLLQVWPKELLERYIELKREEARRVSSYVSPIEFVEYFSL